MMLALAPPMPHSTTVTTVEHPHRPPSSTASSSSHSTRPSQRKLHSAIIIPKPSSSSHVHVQTPSASRSAPLEARSAHRASSYTMPPSHAARSRSPSINHPHDEDDDPNTPPASDCETSESIHPEPPIKDVHSYEPEKLLRMLASALKRIADMNAGLPTEIYAPSSTLSRSQSHKEHHPPIWWTLTTASRQSLSTTSSLAFHARNVPTIALEGYLNRIHKYCPASNEVFVSLLVYLDRMTRLAREACGKTFPIDMYNIHRLIIAGVTVASKFFSDVFYTNSRYAKVGGLPLAELNQLELQFLLLNDFRLTISCEEMDYYMQMVDLQSKIPEGIDLSQYLPSSSKIVPHPPVGPTEFFAAVDAYFGHRHNVIRPTFLDHHPIESSDATRPSLSSHHSPSRRFSTMSYSSDATSEAGTETDFDGSTDDEPTIRAPHSSASSETMSLRSAASDADSIYTDDGGDRVCEDDEEDGARRPAEGTPGREYMIIRTPS
ncbi:cyclin-domain-containing protein [Laetiporus sulphureus 93-53]|uniref:Cyclin-domain-containing protein n=1 Tax=Laetiporus sulphureus 93-53 TaxID=1314785 RepID=A0A165I6E5_9APHY|nr:cyclin-domain-containing protein [Laetiporus sulphureus 93-53]KZT12654.1 cyclin-domain-containing protein [Laetiporus sulphureus 93-53]